MTETGLAEVIEELNFASVPTRGSKADSNWNERFGSGYSRIQFSFELTLFYSTDAEPASLYTVSMVAETRVLSSTSGTGVFPKTTLSYTDIHNISSLSSPFPLDK